VVRWSVFLLGPAGCGKTAIWRTLMKAQNNAGEKTVRVLCASASWTAAAAGCGVG
jgi:MoxR-like ATPase